MEAIYVSQLFIYPVKSLGGIEVQQSEVKIKGLAFDRRWMLVDEQHRFLTQRVHPQLALFKTSISNDLKSVSVYFNNQSIELPQVPVGEAITAQVWDDVVTVVEQNKELSQWFSENLGITCKLVAFPEENPRPVDPDYAVSNDDQTSLSDGYPILMIGQSSLDDLNSRLAEKVGMERFRPNIVFRGGEPYEEDKYRQFSIGGVQMVGVKPCARCIMTTIDQANGKAGKEPLATLSAYRSFNNKVLFGQNVIPLEKGQINVGDEIFLG